MSDLKDNSKSLFKEVVRGGIYGIGLFFLLRFFMSQFSTVLENYQTNIDKDRAADLVQAASLATIGEGTKSLAREVRGFANEADDIDDATRANTKVLQRIEEGQKVNTLAVNKLIRAVENNHPTHAKPETE